MMRLRKVRKDLLRNDRRGVAALEFAIVAPVLLSMSYGLVESVRYIRTRSLFEQATASLSEMVAAKLGVTAGAGGVLVDTCNGVLYTLTSYAGGLAASIVSVTNTNGTVARDWENDAACPSTGGAIGAANAVSLATAMVPNAGDSVIMVQASFNYVPLLTGIEAVFPATTFHQTTFTRPRYGQVLCTNC